MKIKVSTDGMSISVDVGDKAVSLFSKIATMLVDYLYWDSTKEIEPDPLKEAEKPSQMQYITRTEQASQPDEEPHHGLAYKGFIYWKCGKCGAVRGFCLKKESRECHCVSCEEDLPFDEPLKPLYVNCECGRSFKYMTNMDEEMFDVDCINCGSPVPVKWNGHKEIYETIKN